MGSCIFTFVFMYVLVKSRSGYIPHTVLTCTHRPPLMNIIQINWSPPQSRRIPAKSGRLCKMSNL
jgi:hypothetical protein